MNISEYRKLLEQKKGQREERIKRLKDTEARHRELQEDVLASEKAQAIIQLVAQQTQKELEYRISELPSLALSSIWENPYRVGARFITKRGGTECNIFFERDGKEYQNPEYSVGGGPVDVAAFGLQIAVMKLQRPKVRPVLIADETLKWLKGDNLPELGAVMIQETSHKLGIQILLVSHIEDQIYGADRVFRMKVVSNFTHTDAK